VLRQIFERYGRLHENTRAAVVLTGLVLATCLPFVNRAYFVDDFYHMEMARGLLEHPLRPYDFRTDDNGINMPGWERGQLPRMVNPPLFHYLMAGVMKIWGDAVWKLRTASLLFSIGALFFAFLIGKRFVRRPLAAAILLAVTPAYWMTSYSLLIDCALIVFFLAAFWSFIEALERKSVSFVLASGLLMGLTILVKYFGVLILPVVFLYQWQKPEWRRWLPAYTAYAVCLVVQLLWGFWNIATYGEMHFLATLPRGAHSSTVLGSVFLVLLLGGLLTRGVFKAKGQSLSRTVAVLALAGTVLAIGLAKATTLPGWVQAFYVDKVIVLAAFIGGTFIFSWTALASLAIRSRSALLGTLITVIVLAFLLQTRAGGFPLNLAALLALLAGATLGLLRVTIKTDAVEPKSLFLRWWVVLGLLELVTVMPWTAGRYLLLILPPLVWLFMETVADSRRLWTASLALSFGMGILLTASDYAQANTIKKLALFLKDQSAALQAQSPRPPNRWFYLADTFDGSQPYLLPLGWQNVFPDQVFEPGDLFMKSVFRKSSWWTMKDRERFDPLLVLELKTWLPFRVMDVPGSAGFYASCWGALPWVVTNHPLERFELYRAKDVAAPMQGR
jgi:hypothetical protein